MLTVSQINKALSRGKYILLRTSFNNQYGYNCGMKGLLNKKYRDKKKEETIFISYKYCGLHEYISKKIPFCKP